MPHDHQLEQCHQTAQHTTKVEDALFSCDYFFPGGDPGMHLDKTKSRLLTLNPVELLINFPEVIALAVLRVLSFLASSSADHSWIGFDMKANRDSAHEPIKWNLFVLRPRPRSAVIIR